MSESDRIDGAKIFIFGQIGQDLKDRDSERLLAIIQSKPEYFLGQIANNEIDEIIIKLLEDGELTPELEKMIVSLNSNDGLFREVARMLRESEDMLSIGSASLGELESNNAILDLFKGEKK